MVLQPRPCNIMSYMHVTAIFIKWSTDCYNTAGKARNTAGNLIQDDAIGVFVLIALCIITILDIQVWSIECMIVVELFNFGLVI